MGTVADKSDWWLFTQTGADPDDVMSVVAGALKPGATDTDHMQIDQGELGSGDAVVMVPFGIRGLLTVKGGFEAWIAPDSIGSGSVLAPAIIVRSDGASPTQPPIGYAVIIIWDETAQTRAMLLGRLPVGGGFDLVASVPINFTTAFTDPIGVRIHTDDDPGQSAPKIFVGVHDGQSDPLDDFTWQTLFDAVDVPGSAFFGVFGEVLFLSAVGGITSVSAGDLIGVDEILITDIGADDIDKQEILALPAQEEFDDSGWASP